MGSAARNNSIAIGAGSSSTIDAIALGGGSFAYGDHSMAIGPTAKAGTFSGITPTGEAPSAIALGTLSKAEADSSLAVGAGALADQQYATGAGKNAVSAQLSSLALGSFSTTQDGQTNDVALGSSSATQLVASTPNKTIDGVQYSFAGVNPASTVSVGNSSTQLDRTITNVAAGCISPTSTDAVNGSQLDAIIKAFEAYVAAHP